MNVNDYETRLKTTGRNDPCPCGSGKKYKKCHLAEDEAAKHAELTKAAEERDAVVAADEKAAEKDGETSSGKPGKVPLEQHQKSTKSSQIRDTHTNIPRRGAI
jgi:hypothetical protein